MRRCRRGCRSRSAFTLVEVLVVVTILGIAGVLVIPHLVQTGTLGVQAAGRMTIADILFAQNDAIADQADRRIVFDVANNRYWLTADVAFPMSTIPAVTNALGVNWKGGDQASNYVIDFNADDRFDGVVLENANFGGFPVLEFDELGTPTNGGSVDLVSDNERYRIDIANFTGRVTISLVP